MATSKLFQSYPAEYAMLFLQALDGPVSVELPSYAEAANLRSRLYAFRRAAGEQLDISQRVGMIAPLARITIEGSTLTVSYPKPQPQQQPEPKPND